MKDARAEQIVGVDRPGSVLKDIRPARQEQTRGLRFGAATQLYVMFIQALINFHWSARMERGGKVMSVFARAMLMCVALLAPNILRADSPITDKNWTNHPAIVEIRAIVAAVDAQIANGSLVSKKKEQGYDKPYVDVLREVFLDSNGTIRKLDRSAGSDDSAITYNYYYDSDGHLRFAYFLGGAVNGTHIQHRIYFDVSGKRIWEIQKLVEGPGYTFPTTWPDEDIVFDPKKLSLEDW